MKKDIILAGVGGQGILSIAAAIGFAAIEEGLNIKQSEVHGMSQRGGDVLANLRISDKEIASDLISYGKADLIIGVEPMESLRYLPMLSNDGWLITNTTPFVNIPNYPEMDDLMKEINSLPKHVALDADAIAHEIKSPRSANIVVLGAASPFLDIDLGKIENAIKLIFRSKGDNVIRLNLEALKAGREFAEKNLSSCLIT
jgi:indolepyruvate ferredoxin oxidoreductase beta subunit